MSISPFVSFSFSKWYLSQEHWAQDSNGPWMVHLISVFWQAGKGFKYDETALKFFLKMAK